MKKIILFFLMLVFIAGHLEAKFVKDSIYEIQWTAVAPVIDGLQDNIWKVIPWNGQRWYNVGDPPTATSAADSGVGLSGMSKAMWDANNLYILFYSIDDKIVDIPANANWNQDAIEIYIDPDNNHTPETSLSGNQLHITIPHWLKGKEDGHWYVTGAPSTFDSTDCKFRITDVADDQGFPGWMCEIQLPLVNLGIEGYEAGGQLIGWELQQDECDNATVGRQSMSKWWSNSNNSWANAGIWGTAVLRAFLIDTVLQILRTSASINIDGMMDDAYKNANYVTTNLFRIGDPPTADPVDTDPLMGAFMTVLPMWDWNNLYLFVDVVDTVVTDIPANANWNQDAIEVYIDADNNHATETSLSGNQVQITFPHWLKGKEDGHWYVTGTRPTFDSTGCIFRITDHGSRGNGGGFTEEGVGYNVEIKIPLNNLGIDGATAMNQKIGFELQMDNCNNSIAGRQGMQKWWSASNNSSVNAGIWGYAQLQALVGDVPGTQSSIIHHYTLNQNYPNPFNPSTTIEYAIPYRSYVRLRIFNMLGQLVQELVNNEQSSGYQSVTWDASVASGIYFYRLEATHVNNPNDRFIETKKMILLR